MKKSKAKLIENLIRRECERQKVPYSPAYFRKAKKAYHDVPKTKKHLVG